MNPMFAFVFGLLVGWLIEWVIDYLYWRRRYAEIEVARSQPLEAIPVDAPVVAPIEEPGESPKPDNLKIIKGIGPVIERKLNETGIYTFEQLGNLSTAELRAILGDMIERLSDEESLLQQARDLAATK